YPNHATFATGVDPTVHRLLANWVVVDGRPLPSNEVGPAVPTIFDACRGAGRTSTAVVGDQHLIGVMGARGADEHWPVNGVGDDPSNGVWLDDVDGVTDHAEVAPGARLVGCAPQRWFCPPAGFSEGPPEPGTHGGVRTRSQVAIVAGGHPDAVALATVLNSTP